MPPSYFDNSAHQVSNASDLSGAISQPKTTPQNKYEVPKNFDKTVGSAADFERAGDDIDLNEVQGYKSPAEGGSSDDDVGSFYKPTAIAKQEK